MNGYKIIYNIVGTLLALVTMPVWLIYVMARHKYRHSFLSRAGKISLSQKIQLKSKANIWIHAVSVGEFLLADNVIKKLKQEYPDKQIVVSVTTLTGYEVARQKLAPEDQLIFFPFEFYWIMSKMVKLVNPEIAIITETEIWPNFIYALEKTQTPILMMNGRLSEKSYSRYSLVKPFVRDLLRKFSSFQMQNEEALNRILGLGAEPKSVFLSGNIKFDSIKVEDQAKYDQELADELEIPRGQPLIIMAALEKPGREDSLAIDIIELIRQKVPQMGLIIVPRHPERGADIAKLVKSRGYQSSQRSQKEKFSDPQKEIMIVDTVGELKRFYTIADIVFVGKSLFAPGGGQNMIEPISLGKPTLYGPYTRNFRGIADQLASHQGSKIVANASEVAQEACDLYLNSEKALKMVENGQAFIKQNQGATARTLVAIGQLIKGKNNEM